MSDTWKKVLGSIIKYGVTAVLGALGWCSVSGCCSVPQFFF